MPVSIENASETYDYYHNEIKKIDSNYSDSAKPVAYKAMSETLDKQLAEWKEEITSASSQIDHDLEQIKPKNNGRKLDSENLAVLNYHAKTIQSRLAVEGGRERDFVSVLADIVKNGDEQERQAFIDSYYEILNVAKGFGYGDSYLRDYYREAKESLKSPEQTEYEKAASEAEQKKLSLQTKYMAAERSIKGIKGRFSSKHWVEESQKTIWGL